MHRTIRRLIAVFLSFCIPLSLSACGEAQSDNDLTFGDPNAKDALRICVDVNFGDTHMQTQALSDFWISLQQSGGFSGVTYEIIPNDATARNTAISRIRTEIMAGSGPDVFILQGMNDNEFTEALIPYPQKSMENGIFLPLDEYMENNTRYTEWDRQEPSILAAGRNEEGQQIIPLSYALPLQICSADDLTVDLPDTPLTWEDTLNDPKWVELYKGFTDCRKMDRVLQEDGTIWLTKSMPYYFAYIVGDIADFKNEKLLFTEEELLARVNEILALDTDDRNDVPENDSYSGVEKNIGGLFMQTYNRPMTLIPMYSDDGGVTAMIDAYAAVNRNTKRPGEAFTVIDILMSQKMQQSTDLYMVYLMSSSNLPMHEEIFQKDTPLNDNPDAYILDETFKELCEVRGQITGANFSGRYRNVLNEELLIRCRKAEAEGTSVEALVHEVYADLERRVKE